MNNKSWHSLRILNDGRSALREEKKSVSAMEHAFDQGNVSRLFAVFLTVHTNNNDITIDLYMIFWFYFICIKVSPRQTISSRSLASTLNLACANDVTCSYDVIMRK